MLDIPSADTDMFENLSTETLELKSRKRLICEEEDSFTAMKVEYPFVKIFAKEHFRNSPEACHHRNPRNASSLPHSPA